MKWHLKKIMALCMVFSLVIATGCQAVGGLDLNQVLKNTLKVTSAEGTTELELKLNFNFEEVKQDLVDSMYTEEEVEKSLELIQLLSHVKLVIEQYKMSDINTASYKGYIALGEQEKINFKVALSETLGVIHLDGAKQSFAFDLTGEYGAYVERKQIAELYGDEYVEMYYNDASTFELDAETETTLTKVVEDISELVTDYSIQILPNISNLDVSSEVATINNEATSLMMVRGELQGRELWNWLNSLLNAVLNDREGIEALVDAILAVYESNQDVINNVVSGSLGFTDYEEDSSEEEQAMPLVTDEMKKQFIDELFELLEELKLESAAVEQNNKEQLNQIFNNSLKVNFEYGVDAGLDTRQQNLSLEYKLDEASKEYSIPGLEGFTLKSSSTLWNINGEVKADEPVKSLLSVYIEDLPYMHGFEVANLFEEGSFIDNVLRNQLQITEQYYTNYVSDWETSLYLNEKGQTMLPLRHISEKFGAKLKYDAKLQTISVHDVATDTIIELKVGSDIATVNGEQVQWPAKVELKNGHIFVPARAYANVLGADIAWYDDGFIQITRVP